MPFPPTARRTPKSTADVEDQSLVPLVAYYLRSWGSALSLRAASAGRLPTAWGVSVALAAASACDCLVKSAARHIGSSSAVVVAGGLVGRVLGFASLGLGGVRRWCRWWLAGCCCGPMEVDLSNTLVAFGDVIGGFPGA